MPVISDLPDIGADINLWGGELNTILTALDTAIGLKADTATTYTKTQTDGRYVRTVNNITPDGSGNVTVAGGGGGGGGVGTVTKVNNVSPDGSGNVTLTAAQVGARATGVNILTGEITGLAGVATSNDYTSLNNKPAAAVPLTQVGAVNGVAALDGTGKVPLAQVPSGVAVNTPVIKQNGDGTWPARTTKTADRAVLVFWKGALPGPAISAGTSDAVADLDLMLVLGAS